MRPTHESDLGAGESVSQNSFCAADRDVLAGEQVLHHLGALGAGLVLATVEFGDILFGDQAGDPVDIAEREALQFRVDGQGGCRITRPSLHHVCQPHREVLVSEPVEAQHDIDAVSARGHRPGMLERGDRRLGRGGVDAVADHGQGRFQIRRTRPQRQSTEFGVLDGLRNTFHQKLQHVVGQPRDIGQQRHRNSPPVESALGRLLSVHGRDFNALVAECHRATPDDVVGAASSSIIAALMSVE